MYGYDVFYEELLQKLVNDARESRTGHAYIFEGDEGLGLRTCATLFAASLACASPSLAPCGVCPACIGAKAETNPDIKYINSGEKKSIGVDVMREIVKDAYVHPFESTKKIYIIEDAHLLTEQAQNSFLKILEEPPEFTVFIILASNTSVFLQTVISRCNIIRFSKLSDNLVRDYLEKNYPDSNVDFLVKYAEGNPGKIDDVMNKDNFFALRELSLKMLLPLMSKHIISAYKIAEFAEENKEDFPLILAFWQSMVRDMILISTTDSDHIINADIKNELSSLAKRLPQRFLFSVAEKLQTSTDMLRRYVNLRALSLNLALSIKKEINK